MTKKPILFNFLGISLALMGISIPIQVMIINKAYNIYFVIETLPLINIVLMIVLVASSYALITVSKYSFPILICLVGLGLYNNYYALSNTEAYDSTQIYIGMFFYTLIISSPLFFEHTRKIVLNSNLHYWKTPRRMKKEMLIKVIAGSNELNLWSFDISQGGVFLYYVGNELRVGNTITLVLDNNIKKIARVVRKAKKGLGHYPEGIGLQFLN